jgi:two-component system, OmpR family, response regulator
MSATNTEKMTVIVVDDEPEIREMLASYLGRHGLQVYEADSEQTLRLQIQKCSIDAVLLDVNLGLEDGFAIARRLRNDWDGALLMLTGRGETIDRVVGLEIGADDYITKPFELRELLARLRSVTRRTSTALLGQQSTVDTSAQSKKLVFNDFRLDGVRRELRDPQGEIVTLTTGEFDLLFALASRPGIVQSRDQLLNSTHGRDAAPFDRTIDVQIGRLRKKLGDSGKTPSLIKSVRAAGYVFTPR